MSELETQRKVCAVLDSVHFKEQIGNCPSDFNKMFQDFALLEPISTFTCYPFRKDVEVDLLTSQIATLFHPNPSALDDIELKSRAHGQKTVYCSTMTNDHLEVCLRLASSYCLDYSTLADSIQYKSYLETSGTHTHTHTHIHIHIIGTFNTFMAT